MIAPVDGSGPGKWAAVDGRDQGFEWSPDGGRSSSPSGRRETWLIDVASGVSARLQPMPNIPSWQRVAP